ncbi:MAG TPA: Stp1/IreP family PP2C-type Ser/Thr phosphatase [Peptostreptococcaceae bacterium]|nr:Stp1/IreP family PP2C-type Ser/Thr phosphatase [Peptostreptococcaceae bacterium]
MKYRMASDVGKIRKNNEDYCKGEVIETKDGEIGIFAIADGMGGHKKGEVASKLAVENIIKFLKDNLVQHDNVKLSYITDILKQAYNDVNTIIYNRSKVDSECEGMGTTLTTAVVYKNIIYIGNVGDSRCYICENNSIEQITKDHSLVEELVEKNMITKEEARKHPQRNVITRALGTDKIVIVDIFEKNIENESRILLTTDGLTNYITKNQMEEIVLSDENIEKACEKLIKTANDTAGRDNISVIYITI